MRFGFRLLYNELAWTYDVVSWVVSLGNWGTWQRASLPYLDAPQGDWVLDLAHGTGNLMLDLVAKGLRPVGLDISPFMGRIALRKQRRHGMRLDLVRGDAGRLPFVAGCFRSVVSTFPTEFIFHPGTLREIYRVLTPGGRLVIVPVAIRLPRGLAERFLEWLYQITGQRSPWPQKVDAAMAEIGFRVNKHSKTLVGGHVIVVVATKPEI